MSRRITPVHWKTLEYVFLAAGFQFARQQGSHRAYTRKGAPRPVIIPTYHEVPVTIIRNNVKTAGITREEYFRLLDNTT
jgi:predicted RNA binding protein YcfA (HicA-like mRNA interferase family)